MAVERDLANIVSNVSPENLALFDNRLTALRERRKALLDALAAPEKLAEPRSGPDRNEILETALRLAGLLRELRTAETPQAVLTLREKLFPELIEEVIAHPKEGYLEVIGRSTALRFLAPGPTSASGGEVVSACGRGDWIATDPYNSPEPAPARLAA